MNGTPFYRANNPTPFYYRPMNDTASTSGAMCIGLSWSHSFEFMRRSALCSGTHNATFVFPTHYFENEPI